MIMGTYVQLSIRTQKMIVVHVLNVLLNHVHVHVSSVLVPFLLVIRKYESSLDYPLGRAALHPPRRMQ